MNTGLLIETLGSLSTLVAEENDALASGGGGAGYAPLLPELVETKRRLAGTVEAEVVRLAREPGFADRLGEDERAALAERLADIVSALDVNGTRLRRRIALCDDLMGAIVREAERASGSTSATYRQCGRMATTRHAAPISINGSL